MLKRKKNTNTSIQNKFTFLKEICAQYAYVLYAYIVYLYGLKIVISICLADVFARNACVKLKKLKY